VVSENRKKTRGAFQLAGICEIFVHHSYLTSSLGVCPVEFLDELFVVKIRVFGLSVDENFVILACVFFTQRQRATDRRTDNSTVA